MDHGQTNLSCLNCGRQLAILHGEIGSPRRIEPEGGVRVRIEKNALGESLGWLRCASCKSSRRFDAAYWRKP